MNFKDDSEREKFIVENQRLVHHLLKKVDIHCNEYQDMVSEGTIGLINAVDSFDESRGNTFATYAAVCIQNALTMFFRKNNRHNNIAHLEDVLFYTEDGGEFQREETIANEKAEFEKQVVDKSMLERVIKILLNCFLNREKVVFLLSIAGVLQTEIGKTVELSQSYISRMQKKIVKELKQKIEEKMDYEEIFVVRIIDQQIIVKFPKEYNIQRLSLPIIEKSFAKIALIIQENEQKLSKDNRKNEVIVLEEADKKIEAIPQKKLVLHSKMTEHVAKKEEKQVSIKYVGNKEILEYMQKCQKRFTMNELKATFPGTPQDTFKKLISRATKEEKILPLGRGIYKVIRN